MESKLDFFFNVTEKETKKIHYHCCKIESNQTDVGVYKVLSHCYLGKGEELFTLSQEQVFHFLLVGMLETETHILY